MVRIHPSERRGRTTSDWLDSRHTFSFGEHYDPDALGFRALRVVNEDRVRPGAGFPRHGHRDMEILSYVLAGALEHADSSGGGGVIRPGEIQLMRAGSGITHSEFNHSKDEPVHFLQIWIVPAERGLAPGYAQQALDRAAAARGFRLLASPDGREGSLRLAQDVDLHVALLGEDEERSLALRPGRHAWVQVARGAIALGGADLRAGDGIALSDEPAVSLRGLQPAEVLLFDLA
jgi:quercetin 2,3-dioxygenase